VAQSQYTPPSVLVRVDEDVESAVRRVADALGYTPYAVRNAALLLGLLRLLEMRDLMRELGCECELITKEALENWLSKVLALA